MGKRIDEKKRVKQRKSVFNDKMKVQRKKNLQLYLFETFKYTINCCVILLKVHLTADIFFSAK